VEGLGGLEARLEALRRRIAASSPAPERVRLVAVTKGLGVEAAVAARRVGLADLGENYASELAAKASALGDPGARWHFLGAIQRRQVRRVAGVVSLWHSVARLEEGREISKRSPEAEVLVQVAFGSLPGRNGCPPEEAEGLVKALGRLGLRVLGLMTVAPPGGEAAARRAFSSLAALGRGLGLPELSMGMSDDLEVALEEGATMVRVGRALFGERPTPGGRRE